MNEKIFIQGAVTTLLTILGSIAAAQPAVTPLPQSTQPQVSEQTKALFKQRWADGAAAAANKSSAMTTQAAAQVVPATAKASPSAANTPPENRANQQAYIDQITRSLKGK